jgi:mono/diheme cytochrome c family protein
MPAFGGRLTDEQIWQVTQFLAHMDHLPAAVQSAWQQVPSAETTPAP